MKRQCAHYSQITCNPIVSPTTLSKSGWSLLCFKIHFLKSRQFQLVLRHRSPPPCALERVSVSMHKTTTTTSTTTTPLPQTASNIKSLILPGFNVYVFAQLLFSCRLNVKGSSMAKSLTALWDGLSRGAKAQTLAGNPGRGPGPNH